MVRPPIRLCRGGHAGLDARRGVAADRHRAIHGVWPRRWRSITCKCFTIEGDAGSEIIPKEQAEATLKQEFDFDVTVPPSLAGDALELLGVRRCLYGDGRAAHLMYRLHGEPVSLFIIPGLTRPAAELSLFGHDQIVWTLACGCRLAFREGLSGSPVLVVLELEVHGLRESAARLGPAAVRLSRSAAPVDAPRAA